MLERPVLRWLLRVLGDDAFLPIYLGDGDRRAPPQTREQLQVALEHAFWSLASDNEHPDSVRRQAWDQIEPMVDRIGLDELSVPSFFGQLVTLLHQQMRDPERGELARFWAWPELLEQGPATTTSAQDYYEIHAHFRGSVPIDQVWCWLMTHARARAVLRDKSCQVGLWERTRAELVELASELRERLRPSHIKDGEERSLRLHCMRVGDLACVQYLALLANFRRFTLHQRGRSGLVSFSKSFKGISKLTKRGTTGQAQRQMDRAAVVAVLKRFEKSGARAVELRPTLELTHAKNVDKLKTIVLGYFDYLQGRGEGEAPPPDRDPVVMGLVPSLYKQEVIGRAEHHHGCSKDVGLRGRLVQQTSVWRRQVESLLHAIRTVPLLRMFVVGLDAAGLEMGAPVRALAPVFDLVHGHHCQWNLVGSIRRRTIPIDALQRRLDEIRREGWSSSPAGDELWNSLDRPGMDRWVEHLRIGLTVHAGEDFIDPTTGLREIWEAIEYLGLGDHDRVGHAIAISLDEVRLRRLLQRRGDSNETSSVHSTGPGRWRLRKPSGVHALDLAWSASILGSPNRAELAHAISRAVGVLPMHQAVHESLSSGLFPSSAMLPGVCFFDYDKLESEHMGWIEIDDEWCARYEDLRQRVIDRVRRTGIVIESCPTSNCTVANLDDPPLFGLLEIAPEIRCAVATDDPGVLDAWPEHELARVDAHRTRAKEYRARLLRANEDASFVK